MLKLLLLAIAVTATVAGALTYSLVAFVAPLRNAPSVLLFDSVCVLCNGFVRFVGDHDSRNLVRFASLQSQCGRNALTEHGLGAGAQRLRLAHARDHVPMTEYLQSLVVLQNGHAFTGSDAAMRLLATLDSPIHLLGKCPHICVHGLC
jgi:predicted DCC family thiol-disulfide oxidoreductase YuxK